jgi:hypothetical protein
MEASLTHCINCDFRGTKRTTQWIHPNGSVILGMIGGQFFDQSSERTLLNGHVWRPSLRPLTLRK